MDTNIVMAAPRRSARVGLLAALAASSLVLAACGGNPLNSGTSGGSGSGSGSGGSITVGSANFQENVLLADIYADALSAKGVKVDKHLNINSREVYVKALQDHSIDLVPEYTGNLLDYFTKGKPPATSSDQGVYDALVKSTPSGLKVLQKAAAQDKDTLSVSAATAKKYHLSSIADLKGVASKLSIGAGPEFKTRRSGLVGLKNVYGLTFKQFKPLDSGGPLTVKALESGAVQVANIFSTDPSIAKDHFVVLKDPKDLFSAQNVVPLISKSKASSKVNGILNAVSAKLTTANLSAALTKVEVDKADADTVAKKFLSANGLS
ncbi:MAG: ABC transporter substrate-binding protein [Sciscionella sp.]